MRDCDATNLVLLLKFGFIFNFAIYVFLNYVSEIIVDECCCTLHVLPIRCEFAMPIYSPLFNEILSGFKKMFGVCSQNNYSKP